TLHLTTSGTGSAQLASAVTATLPGNADYSASTATFSAGAVDNDTADITVTAVNDQFVEGTETFASQGLSLTGPATVSGSGQSITITDTDSATVSISAGATAVEALPAAPPTSTLHLTTSGTGSAELASAVTATLPGNADYTASTVTFAAGSTDGTTKDITVT